jgi:hypothetical protein
MRVRVDATGNAVKPGRNDVHLDVSGPHDAGNFSGGPEVHLLMTDQDGAFVQGWFSIAELLAAIEATKEDSE